MQYYVALSQPNGCDYTIRCGFDLLPLKASTYAEAVQESKGILLGDGGKTSCGYTGDARLIGMDLYSVSGVEALPIQDWYAESKADRERKDQERQEKEDRASYERLKKRFGG